MADTLEIFGVEYPNATGIKATDDNGVVRAFIRPTGTKSISANGTGIDVASYASVDVSVPSGTPSLQSKSVSFTPTETAQSQTVTADSGYDGLSSVAASVGAISSTYVGSGIDRRTSSDLETYDNEFKVPAGYYEDDTWGEVAYVQRSTPTVSINSSTGLITASDTQNSGYIMPSGAGTKTATLQLSTQAATTITPSTSAQTAVAAGKYTTGAVTVAAMPSGTAGTPTATKGTVSNHSVSVTPSVTNTTGYITGGTKTGTAVTVSASELASGNKTITQNGTNIDVVGYSTVSVEVQSGSEGESHMALTDRSDGDSNTAIYTGLLGEPTSFFVVQDDYITPSAQAMISSVVYDGTSIHAQSITNTANAQVSYVSSGISYSYSNGTLTITSTSIQFQEINYSLLYSYGGSSANVDTKDVQVGSGATSITFTGLDDEPIGWSCIFKSNFSTSSGYQRVISVGHSGTNIFGVEMDSSAKNALHWTSSYNNGSLTITSQGTNAGGYFHQPGYYQLTYVSAGIRPDAELIQTYTMDQMAVDDLELTIPAYTTTAQSLKAAANLSPTITLDFTNYHYIVAERFLTIPEYSVTTKGKGRQEYTWCSYIYELTRSAANEFATIIDPTKKITSVQNFVASNQLYRLLYWSSSSAIALYATNAYGAYQTPTAPSVSGTTLTVKTPVLGVRGSTSYFTSTYMNALTDIRYQYVIEVYRAPNNLNYDGWEQDQTLQHMIDCIASTDHKLT